MLFLLLIAICLPGVILTAYSISPAIYQKMILTQATPLSLEKLFLVMMVQTLIMVIMANAIGVRTRFITKLKAPFLEAVVYAGNPWSEMRKLFMTGLKYGVLSAVLLLPLYYCFLDESSLRIAKEVRMQVGLMTRILYGGIVEEVLMRWGIMGSIVWLNLKLFKKPHIWGAIIISGVLFGLGHLPMYMHAGIFSFYSIFTLILINLAFAIIFGRLFYVYGLEAAMIAHMFVHLLWYPLDLILKT